MLPKTPLKSTLYLGPNIPHHKLPIIKPPLLRKNSPHMSTERRPTPHRQPHSQPPNLRRQPAPHKLPRSKRKPHQTRHRDNDRALLMKLVMMVRVREGRVVSPERAGIGVYPCGRGERPCSVAAGARVQWVWLWIWEPAQRGERGRWGGDQGGREWSALLEDCGGRACEEGFGEEERLYRWLWCHWGVEVEGSSEAGSIMTRP